MFWDICWYVLMFLGYFVDVCKWLINVQLDGNESVHAVSNFPRRSDLFKHVHRLLILIFTSTFTTMFDVWPFLVGEFLSAQITGKSCRIGRYGTHTSKEAASPSSEQARENLAVHLPTKEKQPAWTSGHYSMNPHVTVSTIVSCHPYDPFPFHTWWIIPGPRDTRANGFATTGIKLKSTGFWANIFWKAIQ